MSKKLFLLSIILILSGFGVAFSQGYVLKIHNVEAAPGENVVVNIEIVNERPIVAFQLDIPLPRGFDYVANSNLLNASRSDGHMIQSNVLPDTNILRIIAFSLSNANFKGKEGVIAAFTLSAPKTIGSFQLNVENAIVSDVSAENLITGTANGTIKIIEK